VDLFKDNPVADTNTGVRQYFEQPDDDRVIDNDPRKYHDIAQTLHHDCGPHKDMFMVPVRDPAAVSKKQN
jgi:hypothetical protein